MNNSPPPETSFANPPGYEFPTHRFEPCLQDPSKTPIVLVACGSYSPVTYLHLRMFEMAKDFVRQNTDFEVVGGYLSPVSDMYKKPGLLSAQHRVHMCTIATEQTSTWLMVDTWEAFQAYQRTAVVLDHFDYEINTVRGGVRVARVGKGKGRVNDITDSNVDNGSVEERRPVRVMLLAGSDLISTMSEPGVWSYADLDHILGRYGTLIVERAGTGMDQATDSLARWRSNIYLISQLIQNDVSSTKVRLFIRRGLSVRYLLPAPVVEYIEQNGLYLEEGAEKGKGKERERVDGERGSAN